MLRCDRFQRGIGGGQSLRQVLTVYDLPCVVCGLPTDQQHTRRALCPEHAAEAEQFAAHYARLLQGREESS